MRSTATAAQCEAMTCKPRQQWRSQGGTLVHAHSVVVRINFWLRPCCSGWKITVQRPIQRVIIGATIRTIGVASHMGHHTGDYYAPARREGDNKHCFCPSVCPSVAYIANNSRSQRPSVSKFGRKGPHLSCDSHTSFKIKRSKVRVRGGRGHTVSAEPGCHTACL